MEQRECKFFNICGGCNYLKVDYNLELETKKNFVINKFKQFGINASVSDVVPMFYPYKYRNKIHLAIKEERSGVNIGFFEPDTQRVVNVDSCLLFGDFATKLIAIIKKYISDFKIKPYNFETKSGTIKYVVARNFENNIMVTIVAANQNFAGKEILYKLLKEKFNKVSLWLNINNRTDSAVFGKIFMHKFGETGLECNLFGVKFNLSPNSFMQTNYEMASKIYRVALKEIAPKKGSFVLDLFSGIGITSCMFAKSGADVLSVEQENSSVKDAIRLAKQNNTSENIKFLCGKCEDKTTEINDFCKNRNVSVFVDPARRGIDETVLNAIINASPQKIVYMSCEPETLSRDLVFILRNSDFKIKSVVPFDMFPKTRHIEVLATLEK